MFTVVRVPPTIKSPDILIDPAVIIADATVPKIALPDILPDTFKFPPIKTFL